MDLQILLADGRPAAGALVAVAEAPVPVPDLGLVADAAGRVHLPVPAPGRWCLRIWHAGRALDWCGPLSPDHPALTLRFGATPGPPPVARGGPA